MRSRTLRPPAEPWAVHIRIRYGWQTYKPMALTLEDPGGRKGLALRKGGFLYESTLDVFAYRAAGKIALRNFRRGPVASRAQEIHRRSTPAAWQISNLRGEKRSDFSGHETFSAGRVGLDELAQCRRLDRAFLNLAPRCPSPIEDVR